MTFTVDKQYLCVFFKRVGLLLCVLYVFAPSVAVSLVVKNLPSSKIEQTSLNNKQNNTKKNKLKSDGKQNKTIVEKNNKYIKQNVKKKRNPRSSDKKIKRTKNNVKKIEKILFLDDKAITELIDEQAKMIITPKAVLVRTRNKGVPSVCLPKRKHTKQQVKHNDEELRKAKQDLKKHIKYSLESNGVSQELIDYLMDHFEFIQSTKKKVKELKKRTQTENIELYGKRNRDKLGIFYKKMYSDLLSDVEDIFFTDKALVLTIWAMETDYGSFIGKYDAFNALYSACMNANSIARMKYFEENIIALAILVDKGYFKRDVISSFDGGLGGCQFMPNSFYKFAVSMDGAKADIINNNADVFASIGNYMHSIGWRYGNGILTEIEMPGDDFDICLVGMNTSKSVSEWLKLGIKPHKNGIGAEYLENDTAMASIIITDVDNQTIDKSKKRAFLVYDNFKVILGYNQRLHYGINSGLLFEKIKNGE